jgi:hypothetical protein
LSRRPSCLLLRALNSIMCSCIVACLGIMIVILQAYCAAEERPASALDSGYLSLYNLDFAAARHQFELYERDQPDDPLGPASQAAGLLFEELNRLGILDSAFFTDSSLPRTKITPDAALYTEFDSALRRSEAIARDRLNHDGKDKDALFAVTLDAGLRADYTALVQHRGVAALHYTKAAAISAQQLLAVCSDCYDTYVAIGVGQYLIGSVSAPVRWILRLGGFEGDKRRGIDDLTLAANRGRYLAPFARILLAIVYVRENDPTRAHELLTHLRDEFPGNQLFPREIARLERATP